MKIIKQLIAEEGKTLYNEKTKALGKVIWCSIDNVSDFQEISDEEAEEIRKAQNEEDVELAEEEQ